MSKLKRLLGALSLVALTVFSSCVDDKVAPEVAALRQAQVDLLNQDVAFRAAQTALEQAEADYQVLVNSFTAANDAIRLQSAQATLDQQLAMLAVTVAQQEALLVQAQLDLEEANAELAQYLATAGLQEAQYYLSQWEIAYYGGTLTPPGTAPAPDFQTIGINALTDLIVATEASIAQSELLLDANDEFTQAYVDAKLQVALEDAVTALAAAEASVPVLEGLIADLEANDGYAAIETLQESLLALAADSVAASEALAAAQEAYDAAVEGGTAGAIATRDNFITNIDTLGTPAAGAIGARTTYRQAVADSAFHAGNLANAAMDTVEWLAYADTLEGTYNTYFVPYITEYEDLIAEAEQDSIDAAEALAAVGGDQSLEDDVQDTYNLYIVEYNLMQSQAAVGGTPGEGQITAWNADDTTNLVTLRTAFDGLNSAQMFTSTGDWKLPLRADQGDGTTSTDTSADSLWTWQDPSHYWEGARDASASGPGSSAGPGDGPGVGGATAAYFTGNANSEEQGDVNEANTRLAALQNQLGDLVDGFRMLDAYIAEVRAGTEENGLYEFDVPDSPLDGTDFEPYRQLVDQIRKINEAIELTEDDDYESFCDVYSDLFGMDSWWMENCMTPPDLGDATNPSIKAAKDLAATSATGLDSAQSNITYAISSIGQDRVDAYLAALEVIAATDQATLDAYGLALVAPRVALEGAQSAYAAVISAQNTARADINEIESVTLAEYQLNDDNFTVLVTFEDIIKGYQDQLDVLDGTGTGSIAALTDQVERLNVDIALAAQGALDVQALIENEKADLAVYQTELTVLQAIADAYQALVLAAIGG